MIKTITNELTSKWTIKDSVFTNLFRDVKYTVLNAQIKKYE